MMLPFQKISHVEGMIMSQEICQINDKTDSDSDILFLWALHDSQLEG